MPRDAYEDKEFVAESLPERASPEPAAKAPRLLPALETAGEWEPTRNALTEEHGRARGLAEVLRALQATWLHATPLGDELAVLPTKLRDAHFELLARSLATYSISTLRGAVESWTKWTRWTAATDPPTQVLSAS